MPVHKPCVSLAGLGILSNLSNLVNLEELDIGCNYRLNNGILPSMNKLSTLKILNFAGNGLNGSIYMKGKLKVYSKLLSNEKS